MEEAWRVYLGGVVSHGWLTGRAVRHRQGKQLLDLQTRPLVCRVEDAPEEAAELMAWLTRGGVDLAQLELL